MRRIRFAVLVAICLGLSLVAVEAQRPPEPHKAVTGKQSVQSLRRQYFDRHFVGVHPAPQAEFGGATAGSKLFEMRGQRADALAARVRATALPAPQTTSTSAGFPGLLTREPLGAGSFPTAVATGDFNRDGHLDFAVANGETNDIWIYLGNGDNTFQLPRIVPLKRGVGPVSIVAADLRNIGTPDLIVGEIDTGTVGVLLGNGDGTFANETIYTVPGFAAAVTVNDFNHDGKLDIVAALWDFDDPTAGIAMLPGDGSGTFGQPIVSHTNDILQGGAAEFTVDSGDINNDGYPDLIVLQPTYQSSGGLLPDAVVTYLNNGDGSFTESKELINDNAFDYHPTDARLADVNGDGCPDALISDLFGVVWVGLGDCAGDFTLNIVPMGGPATTVRVADVDGDGNLDLITGSALVQSGVDFTYPIGTTVGVALGDGKGNFGPARVYMGGSEESALAVGDFVGNHRPSIVTADVDTDTVTVYANNGNADFGAPEGIYLGKTMFNNVQPVMSSYTIADLNGDGKPDLFQVGGLEDYYSMALLNDGTGRFTPVLSSFGTAASQQYIGDYRLGDFRNTGHLDFVGIGAGLNGNTADEGIFFQPGNGDGTFGPATMTPVTNAMGTMTTADFNSDGKLDFVSLVAGNGTHTMTPFYGNGDGTFRVGSPVTFTDQSDGIGRAFSGDFNRDGKADVLVFTTINGSVWEFDGNGDGTFKAGRELYNSFQPFSLADMNNDGHPDIVRYDSFWPDDATQTDTPPKITTYLGQANGTFTQSSSYTPYPSALPEDLQPDLQFGDPAYSSLTADYSGDGNIDVAAFEDQKGYGKIVQFLKGNGDGTLVPSYDIFILPLYHYPLFSYDLNHDGRADGIMFDNGSGTTITIPGAPTPALQVTLANYVINGNSNCGFVFANVSSASSRNVTFASSVSGVVLPTSVALPAGALSAQFCYTLAPGYDQTRVHDIQATLDGDTATVYASQGYVQPFGISLSSATTDPLYPGGQTDPVTVTVNGQGNYAGTVTLGCNGLPAGFSCTFTPSEVTVGPGAPASAQIVIQTPTGVFETPAVTITADDGVSVERQTLTVQVTRLRISVATPSALVESATPGTTTTSLDVTGIAPFTFTCSGLPAGATCNVSEAQTPSLGNFTATITVPAGVTPANSPLTIAVQSGGYSAQTSETVAIFSVNVQAPPSNQDWAPSPSSASVSFPVQFANLPNAVTLGCTLDGLSACQTTTAGLPNSTTAISETLNVPSGIAAGQHTLTVSVTVGGSSPLTYPFPFWIADFNGTLGANTASTSANGSASVTDTLTATAGFSSTIALSCAGASQIACSFQPSSVNLAGGTPATFTATLAASNSAANHSEAIRGRKAPVMTLALLLPAAFAVAGVRRRWRRTALWMLAGMTICGVLTCCGGSGGAAGSGGSSSPSTYNVTIVGRDTSLGVQHNLGSVTVTVNH